MLLQISFTKDLDRQIKRKYLSEVSKKNALDLIDFIIDWNSIGKLMSGFLIHCFLLKMECPRNENLDLMLQVCSSKNILLHHDASSITIL